MSGGVVFFSKSPFRFPGPTESTIVVPLEMPTIDGGAPATADAEYAGLDCGGPASGAAQLQLDGNYDGDVP